MGSPDSGYALLYWDAGELHITPMDTVWFDRYALQKQANTWYVVQPKPRKGASGQVISICGDNPMEWDVKKWNNSRDKHGGLIHCSGWVDLGNLIAPTSKTKSIISKSKRTRPGPIYWKAAFLPMFPEWAQEVHLGFH